MAESQGKKHLLPLGKEISEKRFRFKPLMWVWSRSWLGLLVIVALYTVRGGPRPCDAGYGEDRR